MQPDITYARPNSNTATPEALPHRCCPDCFKNGILVDLKPFQINLDERMYACTQHGCNFPLMEANIQSYVTCQIVDKVKSSQSRLQNVSKSHQTPENQLLSKEHLDDLRKEQALSDRILETSLSLSGYEHTNVFTTESSDTSLRCVANEVSNVLQPLKPHQSNETANRLSAPPSHSVNSEDPAAKLFESLQTIHLPSTQDSSSRRRLRMDEHSVTTASQKPVLRNGHLPKLLKCESDQSVEQNKHNCHEKENCARPNSQSHFNEDNKCLLELPPPPRHPVLIQWQNECNLCWLDVLLQCLVNSTLIRMSINSSSKIHRNNSDFFHRLCSAFDETQAMYEKLAVKYVDTEKVPMYETLSLRSKLSQARIDVLKLLETTQCMKGTPESAMELFPNLIKLDSAIKDLFSVSVRWEFKCEQCGHEQLRRSTTSLISFPSTTAYFHPLNATFLRPCFKCLAEDQPMTMIMESIPPCLMMHFLHGLPHSQVQVLDFGIQGTLYSVCAVIQYITKPCNHFVVWIRDTKSHKWLCCDDLKGPACSWKLGIPKIPADEIHMVMWEKQGLHPTLATPDEATDDKEGPLRRIVNEAVIASDENGSETCVDVDETIDLTDQASKSGHEEVDCVKNDTSLPAQSPPEHEDIDLATSEDARSSDVFDEMNREDPRIFFLSEMVKDQLQECSAIEPPTPRYEGSSHCSDETTNSFTPIPDQKNCLDSGDFDHSSSTVSRNLKRKRKKARLILSSSSDSDEEMPPKKPKTEESPSFSLNNYFQVPSSMLKSILSPAVVLTDCLKTMNESSRKRLSSTSDDDSSSSSVAFFESENQEIERCGSALQHRDASVCAQGLGASPSCSEQAETFADDSSTFDLATNSAADKVQATTSSDLSESYINVLKFKKKSKTAIAPYRFTGKANYFSQKDAKTCHNLPSGDHPQSASSDCDSAEYICVAPQLGTEESFTKHSSLPLKEVDSQLDLGTNSNMLLTHHYNKRQPLKSLMIVDPPPVRDLARKTSQKEAPTPPDEEAHSDRESEDDSSEDACEDEFDEWKPSWEKQRQKQAEERLAKQARLIKPPSTRTVKFLNLPIKLKPVKSKLLVSSGVLKSYEPKSTNRQHHPFKARRTAFNSEISQKLETSSEQSLLQSQSYAHLKEIPFGKQTSPETSKKKIISPESINDVANSLHQDLDSGYGGSGSRSSSVVGDHQNDFVEKALTHSTGLSRDLITANPVQPAVAVPFGNSASDTSSITHPLSTSNDLEDLLDALPIDINLSMNCATPGNIASNVEDTLKPVIDDIFGYSEDLFSLLNVE